MLHNIILGTAYRSTMNNGLRVRRILPPVELCMCWGSLPRTCYATLLTVLSVTVNRGCLALRGTTFSSDPWGLCMVRTVSVRGMRKKSVMYSQIQMFIFGHGNNARFECISRRFWIRFSDTATRTGRLLPSLGSIGTRGAWDDVS